MHDLIREMGRGIVVEESLGNPECQSGLWDAKEIWVVLESNKDLENLKRLDLTGSKNLIELPDFSRALKHEDVDLRGCTSLRDVHPSILSLQNLVTLLLDGCNSLQRLESSVHLGSLSNLGIWGCKNVKKFSVTSEKMEVLHLDEMDIVELSSSIGQLNKLRNLYITNCSQLKNLPNQLCSLKSLYTSHF
ncbi:hypothetical protein L6164_037391 [Bauhinia variegata]|uniref:Uncharacterized protein n=1 Tax=Bauhinia variegata TaxID=167791 RepID=A0ACB9KK04_BAUVA|nr:hypothetical protein L6164_037391 [Bauhinia variegata]